MTLRHLLLSLIIHTCLLGLRRLSRVMEALTLEIAASLRRIPLIPCGKDVMTLVFGLPLRNSGEMLRDIA